jgi:recombination protein RecA
LKKEEPFDFNKFIEDSYSKYVVSKEEGFEEAEPLPTGSLSLDVAIGIGGLPRGKFTTIYGAESSGKTTIALSIAKIIRLLEEETLYIDVESGLDYPYVNAVVGGFDPSYLTIIRPETAEQAFQIAEGGIVANKFGLIVLDSVGALAPQKLKDDDFGDSNVALLARMMAKFLPRNAYRLKETNTAFLFVNQVRDKIGSYMGGYTMPGGHALYHQSSVIIFLGKGQPIKEGDQTTGILSKFTIKKNKVAPPFKTGFIPLKFGEGIDVGRDALDFATGLGIVNKSGSWYSFDGEKLGHGANKAVAHLLENPEILDKIREMCYNKTLGSKNVPMVDDEELEEVQA